MTAILPRFTLQLALVFLAGFTMGAAQPAVSPDHVTFYTEPNFRGEALTVEAGATVENLSTMIRPSQRPWIFAISSVKVEGAAKAIVTSAPGLQGDRLEITRSISDLYGESRVSGGSWDRAIAAVSVTGPRPTVTAPSTLPPVRYEPPPAVVHVVPRPTTPPPVYVRRPVDMRAVDAAIHRAFREVLGRTADPQGLRLYRERIISQGWTEEQVIRQLQQSDEARGVDATAAITKAYREVLGRDPDQQGLNHYRARWRDGWTQGQIRDDLRRSIEGRTSHIQSVITRAYRDILGRDPDPSGYANYERLMRDQGYTERDVRSSLMSSEEYRERRRR